MIAAWLITLAGRVTSWVPLRLSYSVAAFAGIVTFYIWPRGRRATLCNYRRVLPGASRKEVRRVARSSLANYCRYLVDFFRLPLVRRGDAPGLVVGEESFAALDRGLERGRGVLIVCTHFGNWDLGASAAAARGYAINVVVETFASERLNEKVVASRKKVGLNVRTMERAGPSLIRALRRNEILALLVDRPVSEGGVEVPFFGETVEIPPGPARLALASGAMIMPVAFPRRERNSEALGVLSEEPFAASDTGNRRDDVVATMARIMAAHEGFIRQHPDQWYMFREMWRPPSDSGT